MDLSNAAIKLQKWFTRYNLTATQYSIMTSRVPKRGTFKTYFSDILAWENPAPLGCFLWELVGEPVGVDAEDTSWEYVPCSAPFTPPISIIVAPGDTGFVCVAGNSVPEKITGLGEAIETFNQCYG